MAATPQFGQFTFVGMRSRKTIAVDAYISDVNGAAVNLDGGNGASATSPTYRVFNEPVVLTDFAIITGTADTEKLQITRNGVPSGNFLRYTLHLNTLSDRPALRIGVLPGALFSAIQVSD